MSTRSYFFVFLIALVTIHGYAQKQDPLPTLVSAPTPAYPKEAKEALLGGKVTVRVSVDEAGNVVSVDQATGPAHVCKSRGEDPRILALRNAVIDAVKQAKFQPATKDGKAVKSVAFITSTFDPWDRKMPGERPEMVNGGVVNGKAKRLPKPEYPFAARAARAGGTVSVEIVIDEKGEVFTAAAIGGPVLLRGAAEDAACKAEFSPTLLDGKPIRIRGVLTYAFMP